MQAMAAAHEQVRRAAQAFEAQLTQLQALQGQLQQCAYLNQSVALELEEALPGHVLVWRIEAFEMHSQALAPQANAHGQVHPLSGS